MYNNGTRLGKETVFSRPSNPINFRRGLETLKKKISFFFLPKGQKKLHEVAGIIRFMFSDKTKSYLTDYIFCLYC